MPEAVIGLDVGKSSHWACVATRDGEILLSAPVANREGDLDSLFGRFPDALVVVDQSRNIGALALARAKAAGMSAAYLPGLAALAARGPSFLGVHRRHPARLSVWLWQPLEVWP